MARDRASPGFVRDRRLARLGSLVELLEEDVEHLMVGVPEDGHRLRPRPAALQLRADAALAKFDAALDYAAAAALDDARWSAEVGRAEALTKLGRADAAIRAFEQLESCVAALGTASS